MIVYPLKDKYEYYRIFKRTVDFATSTYRWLTICSDPKEDGKPCLVCRDCRHTVLQQHLHEYLLVAH